jgi:hypothetical protein
VGSEAGSGFEVEGAVAAFIVSRDLIRYGHCDWGCDGGCIGFGTGFILVHGFAGVVVDLNPDVNLFNFFGFIIIINAVSFIILTLNYII